MKAKYIVVSVLLSCIIHTVAIAQQTEWVVYGGKTGVNGFPTGINVDPGNNVYLCGVSNAGINDSVQLDGHIQPFVRWRYIVKVDNQGNFIKAVNFYARNGRYNCFDKDNKMYLPIDAGSGFNVDILDSNLNYDTSFYYSQSPWGNLTTYYHLAKNGYSYYNGFHATHPTQLNYRYDSFTFSPTGAVSFICNTGLFCTDIYKADSVGNDFCTYYNGSVDRNGISTLVHPYDTVAPLSEINFNNDSTYSLAGRCLYGIPCQLAIDSAYLGHYFILRVDISGNCMWAVNLDGNFPNGSGPPVFDKEGNGYVDVYVKDSIRIGNYMMHSSGGLETNYIIKINKLGLLEWFFPVSTSVSAHLGIGDLSLDDSGNIFVAGDYYSLVDSLSFINIINYGTLVADTTNFASQGSCIKAFFAKFSPPQTRNLTICPGDSVYFAGAYHSSAGIYYDTLSVNAPHDSVITLFLTVASPAISAIQQSNDTLLATAVNATGYQWFNCDSNIVYNFNQPYFIPPYAGNYAAIAHTGSCADTSNCINYSITSFQNLTNAGEISIYPNPTYSGVTINFRNKTVPSNIKVVLYDVQNKKVMEVPILENMQTINLNNLNQGMFMLTVISDKVFFRSMVVKLP